MTGLHIAIDVDGVLANQIDGILDRLNRRLNTTLRYEDIRHWRYEFAGTNIATEILRAMETDPSYVEGMPLRSGAREMLEAFPDTDEIVILTARPTSTTQLTESWLTRNALRFDAIIQAKEAFKSEHGADVLVDDYLGNAMEFLSNSGGLCILVDQPWNRDREELEPWLSAGRAFVVQALDQVAPLVNERRGTLIDARG